MRQPKEDKLATTVYDTEEIVLQNGTKVTLKPLTIKQLRKFMVVVNKLQETSTEDESLNTLLEACAIALEKQLEDVTIELLEDILDVPTINRILEVCGGIKMDDPNLLAAAVLAGQN